jgi:hypothetical protein
LTDIAAPPRIQRLMTPALPKRILVVAHDKGVRVSRGLLLKSGGYRVESVDTDDSAMELLEVESFDLVLLGRNSKLNVTAIDKRLRYKYPDLLTLKVDDEFSAFPTRMTGRLPEEILDALREMLT